VVEEAGVHDQAYFHHSVFLSGFPPIRYLVVIVYFLQQSYVFAEEQNPTSHGILVVFPLHRKNS
jgi:hypothetical protein